MTYRGRTILKAKSQSTRQPLVWRDAAGLPALDPAMTQGFYHRGQPAIAVSLAGLKAAFLRRTPWRQDAGHAA